jgi:hypothetical protein
MKRLIHTMAIIAFLAITMTSCEDAGLGVIEIRFENISTSNLENFEVYTEVIGDLEAGERTDYQVFEHISMRDNRPSASMSAMVGDIKLHNNNYDIMVCGVFCGNEDYSEGFQLQPGKYTVTIDVEEAKAEQNVTGGLYIDIIED